MIRVAIVTTTIRLPTVLDSYTDNLQRYGHEDVGFIVVGDLKTPIDTFDYVRSLQSQGWRIEYWDVERQRRWLKAFPELDRFLPYNSVQRRNLGFLFAYLQGAEIIVSIDDDNFALPSHDFVGEHNRVGETQRLRLVESSTGWFNVCDLLATDPPRRIYPRGFPHSKRWKAEEIRLGSTEGRVAVNSGLWLETPDVDAVTHLEEPVRVAGFSGSWPGENVALARGTWSPFNTQNTAFHRDLLPCMYLPVMGQKVNGLEINRYDDILASYFIKTVLDHLGGYVAFGEPLVRQTRNPHDYLVDLAHELPGMLLVDKLVDYLEQVHLEAPTYAECYKELADDIRAVVSNSRVFSESERRFLTEVTQGMEVWLLVVEQLQGGRTCFRLNPLNTW